MSVLKRVLVGSTFIFSAYTAFSQTYVFAELQGQPTMNTTGWNLTGAAAVGDTPGDADSFNNELILTPITGNTSGAIFFGQPLNLTSCTKWKAQFEFRIFGGSGADGIAFCFLDVPPTGFVSGGGVGIPATANGLKVVFDQFDNGCGANPEIQIYNGVGYNECITGIVKVNNTGGNLNFIRSNTYNAVEIVYDNGNVSVTVNGTNWLNATGMNANFAGYLGFTSSTGGSTDMHSIRNVTIYADVAASEAGPNVSYCTGSSVQIGTTPDPNYTYSWSPAIGLSATNVANPTVSLTNTGSTPVNITYTVTTSISGSSSQCHTQDQVVVTVNPIPTSSFTLSKTNICPNEPITVTYTGNMGALSGYTWNFNGGTVLSGSGQGPYQVSWPTSGPVQVSLAVSQSGCYSDTTKKTLTVHPNPVLTVSGPPSICLGDTAVYTGTTDVNGSTIAWTPGPLSGSPVYLSPNVTTTYTAKAVSPIGCLSNDTTFTLTVKPIPVASIAGDTLICKGDSTQLVGSSDLSGSGFVWLPPLSSTNAQPWVSPSQTQEYGLVVTKDGCASDTAYFTLQVDSVPNISTTDSITLCKGETITINATSTTLGTSFEWQPGSVSGDHITVSPVDNITYSVYAYNANCTSETKNIEVVVFQNCDCKLNVPNVFTPNGDQVNDEFMVLNTQNCNIAAFDFILYNRWGAVVWKSSDIQVPWDGKCLISNCSDGTYYWVFTYSYIPGGTTTTKSVTEKGILTVVH